MLWVLRVLAEVLRVHAEGACCGCCGCMLRVLWVLRVHAGMLRVHAKGAC